SNKSLQASTNISSANSNEAAATTTSKADGYAFEFKGTVIQMNEKAELILEKLGKSKDYFEAESCAFQGLDKTYTYNSFELFTYQIDDIDYVLSIRFLDDVVTTKEGIGLNSTLEQVIAAYGDKYTQKSGQYTFNKGKTNLSFIIENNVVTAVEYMAVVEQK
ncbi:MAG: hypothetical protein ACYDG2_07990, partial [Ruminiclostridium sp.]